eukprot:TRINITY_DN10686_c0_g1_i2.p1 TRINITY_DN10686_c0_g1~~TRINITY_DN10686_c0_g1_i2.p1  ORF type:complete len:166 (+),score=33.96 TRINITY_DN10686_c0_g1_i2:35-499(+)
MDPDDLPRYKERIRTAFEPFDLDAKGVCDVREVGAIIRSLGLNPSEQELLQLIKEMEEDEPSDYVTFEKLESTALRVLGEETMGRDDVDKILRAFRVLDHEKKGYLEPEELRMFMTTKGERFTDEEIQEMLESCIDSDTGLVDYEAYAKILADA